MEQQKKKVLLIDDNEITRLMFSNIFWLHGLDDDCLLTATGHIEEALSLIQNPTTRPDIIFTGLVMPFAKNGKTETSAEAGLSIIKYIKETPETQSIRVIVLSAAKDEDSRTQALSLGAETYLEKGEIMPQDLVKIIHGTNSK